MHKVKELSQYNIAFGKLSEVLYKVETDFSSSLITESTHWPVYNAVSIITDLTYQYIFSTIAKLIV